MATIEQVTVTETTMSAPGEYGERVISLRESNGNWSAYDKTSSVAGPFSDRKRLVKAVYAILCKDDPSVPGSDAAWRLKQQRKAAEIAKANARWAAVMAACGEEGTLPT
jgi:hypothetical protein